MSRLVLKGLLAVLGFLLTRASRNSETFRLALTRDRTVVFTAGDVTRHFVVRDRAMTSRPGIPSKFNCLLRFTTPGQALRVFTSTSRVPAIVNAMLDGHAQLEGNFVTLLWFEGRIQQVLPYGNQKRKPVRLAGAYIRPRDDIAAGQWINRQPMEDELDSEWMAAWAQRRELRISRVVSKKPAKAL